jgi:DNA-binding beta-propeller fold protein YncE
VTDAPSEQDTTPGTVDAEVAVPDVSAAAINIQNISAISDYGHGLALSPDGTRAYVAYRSPSSVLVIDAGLGEDGRPRNRVLGFVSVGSRPTELAVLPRADGKGDLIYVACFGTNNVYVVDSLLMDVVDVIPTGVGPYDIAVVDDELVGRRAYVSLFEESAIAVIDLDPGSPFYHQVIAEIR